MYNYAEIILGGVVNQIRQHKENQKIEVRNRVISPANLDFGEWVDVSEHGSIEEVIRTIVSNHREYKYASPF